MNILFVDDHPESKVNCAIEHLTNKGINFKHVTKTCVNSACRYVATHSHEIDLAVIDLGLPHFKDGSMYSEISGIFIIDELARKKIKIPVIINSTTAIPDEEDYLKNRKKNFSKILHIASLEPEWFESFVRDLMS